MLYIFILGGYVLSLVFGFQGVQNTQWYLLFTATLLAIGLYSSTFGISIKEAKRHIQLILTAVTIGVLFKALITGFVLSLVLQNPFGFILGIIVAQIDPLSTAALLNSKRLSARAKTIIAAWSSFDDPVTVIMSLYFPVLIATFTGEIWRPITGTMQDTGLLGYLETTGINILFAAAIFGLWMFIKKYAKASRFAVIIMAAVAMYSLVIGSLSVAVYFFWMLGVALLGLFMRPPVEKILNRSVRWALYMAALLLGLLLVDGINLQLGFILGMTAFGTQIIVGFLLTGKLKYQERVWIAFSQQNGITAIILALLFEPYYPGTISIVAPAIIVINATHSITSHLLDAHFEQDWSRFTLKAHKERVKAHMRKV